MTIDELLQQQIQTIEEETPFMFPDFKTEYLDGEILAKNFVQELLTTPSPILKPGYGTTFIQDLGEIVNVYKMQYYLQKNADLIKDKYHIVSVEITNADKSGDMLIGNLTITFDGDIKTHFELQINWKNKYFTTEAIVE